MYLRDTREQAAHTHPRNIHLQYLDQSTSQHLYFSPSSNGRVIPMPMFLAPGTRLAPLLAASMNPGPPPVQTTKCWLLPVQRGAISVQFFVEGAGQRTRQRARDRARRKSGRQGRGGWMLLLRTVKVLSCRVQKRKPGAPRSSSEMNECMT